MQRRFLFALAVVAVLALPAGAWAGDDGFLGVGTRFAWDNHKTPILIYDGMDAPPGRSSLSYGGPNMGGTFNWGVTNQLVLTISLDLAAACETPRNPGSTSGLENTI